MRTKRFIAALACAPLLLNSFAGASFAGDRHDDSPGNGGKVRPIRHFPEPESFTKRIQSIPNPFVSWEGNKVDRKEWPARAAQLRQIMEHYETGYLPSTKGITVSLEVTRAQSG